LGARPQGEVGVGRALLLLHCRPGRSCRPAASAGAARAGRWAEAQETTRRWTSGRLGFPCCRTSRAAVAALAAAASAPALPAGTKSRCRRRKRPTGRWLLLLLLLRPPVRRRRRCRRGCRRGNSCPARRSRGAAAVAVVMVEVRRWSYWIGGLGGESRRGLGAGGRVAEGARGEGESTSLIPSLLLTSDDWRPNSSSSRARILRSRFLELVRSLVVWRARACRLLKRRWRTSSSMSKTRFCRRRQVGAPPPNEMEMEW